MIVDFVTTGTSAVEFPDCSIDSLPVSTEDLQWGDFTASVLSPGSFWEDLESQGLSLSHASMLDLQRLMLESLQAKDVGGGNGACTLWSRTQEDWLVLTLP